MASAGNDGDGTKGWDIDVTSPTDQRIYPASEDSANILAVAATDQDDAIATFSNFGA
ncbi:MAG: hypothetical protein KJ686_14930, partial [Actinobacteria bacterium]|nr:hypothetical protein [Actinomycetota bacterium]